jgi:hypothetical protein
MPMFPVKTQNTTIRPATCQRQLRLARTSFESFELVCGLFVGSHAEHSHNPWQSVVFHARKKPEFEFMAYSSLERIVPDLKHDNAHTRTHNHNHTHNHTHAAAPMSVYGGSFSMFMHVAAIGRKALASAGAAPRKCMSWI